MMGVYLLFCHLLSLLSLLIGVVQSQNCPDHCVICLNAVWICNKWKASYDLSNHDDIATINSNAFINAGQALSINIATNLISTLESNAFVGLNSLQTLNLSHNQITSLPDTIFSPLTNLKTLDLSHNTIPFLNPNAFQGLTNLNKLYLNSNQLMTLSSHELTQLINKLPSLQNLTLAGNNWHCDCNITELQSWLLTSPLAADPSLVTCRTPTNLANSLVVNLNFYIDPLCFSVSPSPSPSLELSPSPSFLFSPSPSPFSPSPSPLSPSPSSLLSLSPFLSSSLELSPSPSFLSLFISSSDDSYSSSLFPLFSSVLFLSSSPLLPLSQSPSGFFSLSPSLSLEISSSFYLLSPSPSLIIISSSHLVESSQVISSSSSIYITSSSVLPSLSSPLITTSNIPSPSSVSSYYTPSPSHSSSSSSPSPSLSSPLHHSPSPSHHSPITLSSSFSHSLTAAVPVVTSISRPIPTPTPQCQSAATQSDVGTIHWPLTDVGNHTKVECPYGPAGAEAIRHCVQVPSQGAVWGAIIDGACFTVDNRLQQLLFEDITANNVVMLSKEIANMPFGHFSADALTNFVTIATRIMNFGQSNVTVVVNVLSAVDLLLASDNAPMLQSSDSERLQSLITTALFDAVNVNRSQLILQFSQLFIGGKYTTDTQVQVEVEMQGEGRLSFVPTHQVPSGELVIEVDVHSNELQGHTVQVTILGNDSSLYSTTGVGNCLLITDGGMCNIQIISPIAVTAVSGSRLRDESVNVTFENIMFDPESSLYCAMWDGNITTREGGQWDTTQCQIELSASTNTVLCSCTMTGPVAVIQALFRNNTVTLPTHSPSPVYNMYAVWIFYILVGVSVLLHLPVIITAIRISYKYDYVRNIQAVSHHGITQALIFFTMMISFQRTEVQELCLTFGSLLHYFILVSYLWLTIRTIVLCMSQVRYKKLYEKDCFILPFFFIAWSLPIVPIVVYGVLAFTNTDDYTIENCWIESFVFPNYFVYLITICSVLLISTILITGPVMACSSFVIVASSYYQLFGLFIESVVYTGTIALYFITGAYPSDELLGVLAAMIFVCSSLFFVTNGLLRPIVRRNIICQRDPRSSYDKGRPFSGQETPTTVSSIDQVSKRLRELRQQKIRQKDEMDLDYIGGYLGYPLEMWSEVGEGRRIRKKGFVTNDFTRGSSEA